jgi:glutamate dehydrogenase
MLENMGFRVVNERTFNITSGRGRQRPPHLAARHDARARQTAGESISSISIRRSRRCSWRCARLHRDPTATTGCPAAGLAWRDIGTAAGAVALSAPGAHPLCAGLHRGRADRHSGDRAAIVKLFHAASTRIGRTRRRAEAEGRARAHRDRARGRLQPRRGPHPAPLRQRSTRRCAPTSSRSARTGSRRARSRSSSIRPRSTACRRRARPRDLRLRPRVEGVHLRFGKVARGGLRWSDRPQDFRTEVLGLVKAQQVKNAVIVPVGAKGGFVPKRCRRRPRPRGRGWRRAPRATSFHPHAADAHRQLVGDDRIVPPANVVRHDGDDPYLVVAADKGTATFSDTANASRPSAWLLARRRLRLRRLGRLRPQGHGHHRPRRLGGGEAPLPRDRRRHPDDALHRAPASATCPATSSATACCCRRRSARRRLRPPRHLPRSRSGSGEEPSPNAQRMFALPRSSWADYDKSLISKGGGIFRAGQVHRRSRPQMRSRCSASTRRSRSPQPS